MPDAPYTFERTKDWRWRVKIVHGPLARQRTIIGDDRALLERMAQQQIADWEAAAAERQRRQHQLDVRQRGAQQAEYRSEAARQALAEAESLLAHTLSVNDAINWETLKDHSQFHQPRPQEPKLPPEPKPLDPAFTPELGCLGKLFGSVRRQREAKARALFSDAHAKWVKQRDARLATYKEQLAAWGRAKAIFDADLGQRNAVIDRRQQEYMRGDPGAVTDYCNLVLSRSTYPDWCSPIFDIDYVADSRTMVVDYQLPSVETLPRLKEVRYIQSRDEFRESYISDRQHRSMYDSIIYQITLRTVHELFEADQVDALAAVAFNGWVTSLDPGTGQERTVCIVSLHVTKNEFAAINLARVVPKECFRALKGIGSPRLYSLAPVAPLMQISREDRRFVQAQAVLDELDAGENLAAMPWDDFEHLVRELFEKEFAKTGGEVKVTQASRDGGVDAIAFDPEPIRGGKIVIQAKRYTNTVGVSAVRDLYGTVLNEGATKGILVTTSGYGPDAYEFAKDKPLTLLDGANLLHLMGQHGYRVRINLSEARQSEERD